MLRMVLLGLLIPLGVGVLSAMELRAPPRGAVAVVEPVAETITSVSDSHGVLAKADRLEVAATSTETPIQPASVDGRSPPEDIRIGPSEPPELTKRHRNAPASKPVAAAARSKSRPKAAATKATHAKRAAVSQRSKAARDPEPCRLKAFGGLLKALNSTDCEI